MKCFAVFVLSVLVALGPTTIAAANQVCNTRVFSTSHHRRGVVHNQRIILPYVATAFVPVGTYRGEEYRYRNDAYGSQTSDEQIKRAVKEALAELLGNNPAGLSTADAPPPSLLQANCAKCHSGASASGNFSIDQPLSDADRLRALRAVRSGSMPKDVADGNKPQLSDSDFDKLVDELLNGS